MNEDFDYSDDPVNVYLREISNVRPLTPEQERECVRHNPCQGRTSGSGRRRS
ncbi:MAG: sigma-70 factor domain-containing protein [Bryobacteraceae bacterium]